MTEQERQQILEEIAIGVRRIGLEPRTPEDGSMPIWKDGEYLCSVRASGSIQDRANMTPISEERSETSKVYVIARNTIEYMRLMAHAPVLEGVIKEGEYKLLAEFNGFILAGRASDNGVMFEILKRNRYGKGIVDGHFVTNDYSLAKLNFAARSKLLDKERLFAEDECFELYYCCCAILSSGEPLSRKREKLIESIMWKMELVNPTFEGKKARLTVEQPTK